MKMMLIDKTNVKKNKLILALAFMFLVSSSSILMNSCNMEKEPVKEAVEETNNDVNIEQLIQRTELEDKEDCLPNEKEEVFMIVEDMPRFQGKDVQAFRKYVAQNLNYPQEAQDKGISGKVFVQFMVKADGQIGAVKVVRGVNPFLDQEVIRVVKSSPKWEPGTQRGKKVNVQFTMPITFNIQ